MSQNPERLGSLDGWPHHEECQDERLQPEKDRVPQQDRRAPLHERSLKRAELKDAIGRPPPPELPANLLAGHVRRATRESNPASVDGRARRPPRRE
eukprot:4096010-Prymnesium_polylepis.1